MINIRVLYFAVIVIISLLPGSAAGQDGPRKISPRLNHIACYVVDLKKSTRFYQEVLQLDTIPEPFHDGRHTWFSIAPLSHLHLIQGATNITTHEKNNHLCFTVPSVPDFIKNLAVHKIPYENWAGQVNQVTKRVDGVYQVYFKDPDGYWIEINDAKN